MLLSISVANVPMVPLIGVTRISTGPSDAMWRAVKKTFGFYCRWFSYAGGADYGAAFTAANVALRTEGEKMGANAFINFSAAAVPPPDAKSTAGSLVITRTNLNTATVEELEVVPGFSAAFAEEVVDYRTNFGGFQNTRELVEVLGMSEAEFVIARRYLTL